MQVTNRNLVIMLHGVGSNGANLAPLGDVLNRMVPQTDFVSPDAPFRFSHGAGRQWFSIDGVTEVNRSTRVAEARADFDEALHAIIEAHGLAGKPERVALLGFSQGSIMALDAVASGRWPVAAVVAFSGRLASPLPLTPGAGTPVCLIHGDADPVMPVGESEKAAATLKAEGMQVDLSILAGLGHSISSQGVEIAGHFLAAAFRKG
jgi:phospholipase/carboxylesterase